MASALGGEAIAVLEGEQTLALWADPLRPGGRALLTRALRRSAAVGPAVPWREAVRSLRLARVLARLAADEPDEPGKSDEPGTPDDRGDRAGWPTISD